MARLSSRRRNRLVTRGALGTLGVAGAVFLIYTFNPLGSSEASEAEPAPTGTPAAATSGSSQTSGGSASSDDWGGLDGEQPIVETGLPTIPEVSLLKQTAPPAPGYLDEARRLAVTGDLLAARMILNDALQTNALPYDEAQAVKARLADLNRVIVFTPTKRFADDPYQGEYTVRSGDLLGKIARPLDVPYQLVERINAVKANRIRVGQTLKTIQGPIHAVVSKKHFTMDLYLGALPGEPGSMFLASYRVGLGEDSSTPTGLWEVTRGSKLVNPEWTNPRTSEVYRRDDPENPLGERWIGLTGIAGDAVGQPSYGIHGTIEPETIGTNASMGCIRLTHDDVAAVYDMLVEGKSTVAVVP
jgi:LysM repeat protein